MASNLNTKVRTERLQIRYSDNEQLSIVDMRERLTKLQDFVLASFLHYDLAGSHTEQLPTFTDAQSALLNTRVLRITYNSPLEIVLGVPTAITGAALSAQALASLWQRVQKARVQTAQATSLVLANQVVQAAIRRRLLNVDQWDDVDISQLAESAARAAISIDHISLEVD